MTDGARRDTRTQLLHAAADLIAASPGENFSLREVCDRVGVRLPTLYHFFGSKQGLVEAVTEHGFDLYMAAKTAHEPSGDPIQDLRDGWDAHVAFGLAHPGFYTLMYGTVRPGYAPAAQARPSAVLLSLTRQAADQGRLVVGAEQAAAHVLATNVGVTLRQIVAGRADPDLSEGVRDGVVAAITGAAPEGSGAAPGTVLRRAVEHAAAHPEVLGATETRLLTEWLARLARGS